MKWGNWIFTSVTILLLAGARSGLSAAADSGQFGPFDYYDARATPANAYALVELEHLGAKTELAFRQGKYCGYWADLDYTLRAFPNHPKALMKMAEFLKSHVACETGGRKSSSRSPLDLADQIESGAWRGRTMEYYFDMAIQYRPQYMETRLLYARALNEVRKRDEAIAVLTNALKLEPRSSAVYYELGLLYLEKGEIQSALRHAQKAYQLGKPPPELRDKLVGAGVWK